MSHVFVPVDDCLRCMFCEALVGSPGPCAANTDDPEPEEEPWTE